MQTITINTSNISSNAFEDGDVLTSHADKIVCPNLIISDLNSSNATIHTGVTLPEDWKGSKYFFDGSSWTVNPDFDGTPDPALPTTPDI